MKCPKCGFNSFEYYDSCKKCSSDLTGYKQTYSITSMVLPFEAKEKLAADFRSAESTADQVSDTVEAHDDIFSFDLPDEPSSTPAHHNDNPFNFDEPSPNVNPSSSAKSEDDVFADLLESTSQAEDSPFAAAKVGSAPAPAPAAKVADSSSGPGEFDLESFSWDDTPVEAAATDSKEVADDFDSLFGDTKENPPK
jgi:predicted  nucleic acid-binding Zn-ribbon protein